MPSALPIELILHILDYLLPSNPDEILPPSHKTTKTLVALTKVSRSVSPIASNLVWRHCPKITSPKKARQFAVALASLSPDDPRHPGSLFLGLYQGKGDETRKDCPWPDRDNMLEPSARVDDTDVAMVVKEILLSVAPKLKRMILDMPLASLHGAELGQNIFDILRPGFEALTNLEEFVSVNDSFSFKALHQYQPEVWSVSWPNLRCLSLDNPVMNFFPMLRLPKLETVVVPRKHAFRLLMTGNVKGNLARALDSERKYTPVDSQPFTMTLIDEFGSQWTDLRPNNRLQVLLVDVGWSLGTARPTEPSQLSHVWVRHKALKGLLWDAARSGSGDWSGIDDT